MGQFGDAIAGGWSLTGLYNHWSGAPFTVSSAASSCNCPGIGTQPADLINPNVGVGRLRGPSGSITTSSNIADSYFDVLSYRPVTEARYGTAGFNQLRGPGNDNVDLSLLKVIPIKERFKVQLRGEALNVTNTAHFANPSGTNVSNMSLNADGTLRALNGFGQITATAPLGRIIDQRYFRFSLRFHW